MLSARDGRGRGLPRVPGNFFSNDQNPMSEWNVNDYALHVKVGKLTITLLRISDYNGHGRTPGHEQLH